LISIDDALTTVVMLAVDAKLMMSVFVYKGSDTLESSLSKVTFERNLARVS